MTTPRKHQPVEHVHWLPVSELHPNDYNPNYVPKPELELLYKSIRDDGWTQPIVVDTEYNIVDGFHRYLVGSRNPDITREGCVPVVMLTHDTADAKVVSTIRHNRARGNHEIMAMADIVWSLHQNHTEQEVADLLNMEIEEVERLLDRREAPEILSDSLEFSRGWIPDHTPDRDDVLRKKGAKDKAIDPARAPRKQHQPRAEG